MRCLPKVFFITLLLAIAPSGVTWAFEEDEGVLDRPIPQENPANVVSSPVVVVVPDTTPEEITEELVTDFAEEQEELEQLPREELEDRAEQGERAAMLTLAEDYAEEAALLAFAPEAANDALSDAVKWYALAAQRGFPGAPSLNRAGVKFYPIRAQRTQ